MTNDYTFSILAEQRRQDFAAEAANDQLVRFAIAGRPSWWRRLARTMIPARQQVLAPRHSTS
jgi:hypothetical protein